MRRLKSIILLTGGAILLCIILFFTFKKQLIDYLSVNHPVDAEFLLVEGWVSETTLHYASQEFEGRNYKNMIVSGVPFESWYFMPDNGFFIYDFEEDSILLNPGDSIKIELKGSQALGKYAHFSLIINETKTGGGFSTASWEEHLYVADTSITLRELAIAFDNDDYHGDKDRNLYIKRVSIHGVDYPARSGRTILYHQWDPERKNPIPTNFRSISEKAAYQLNLLGIPADKILILTSSGSKKNRTLNSALAVAEWMEENTSGGFSINIYSENIHARRSWIIYRKALKNRANGIGIICSTGKDDSGQNIKVNNQGILREIIGNLYYRLFFFPFLYKGWIS